MSGSDSPSVREVAREALDQGLPAGIAQGLKRLPAEPAREVAATERGQEKEHP